jgi:hypothetical protein
VTFHVHQDQEKPEKSERSSHLTWPDVMAMAITAATLLGAIALTVWAFK